METTKMTNSATDRLTCSAYGILLTSKCSRLVPSVSSSLLCCMFVVNVALTVASNSLQWYLLIRLSGLVICTLCEGWAGCAR